jgi:hypothetical protein
MDSERALVIGYSGSLAFSDGTAKQRRGFALRDWLWTYNHHVTDPSTRSAYFLFRALKTLKEKYEVTPAQIRVELWGSIDARNRQLAQQLGISEFVQIDGYLPKQQSLERNRNCDMLFLPMESATEEGRPLFIPGKAYEYMKAGKPILALAGPCDCLDILAPSGLLLAFDPHASDAIAEQLFSLISDRTQLSRFVPDEDYINRYSFRNITGKLAGIFDDVLKYGN